jgi:hypothetical protein
MRDINEVIRRKETELQQLQRDIDALRVAARLLTDEEAGAEYAPRPGAGNTYATATRSAPSQAGYGASWDAKKFP